MNEDDLEELSNEEWSNPPKVTDLKKDLENATSDHSLAVNNISDWLDQLHVRGTHKFKPKKGFSGIQPKLLRKHAEWRYASLSDPFLSSRDLFKVKPRTWEDQGAAKQNQLVLNYQFNSLMNKVKLINDYIRTVVNEGTAVLKVGWEFEQRNVKVNKPIYQYIPAYEEEQIELLEQAMQMMQSNPYSFMRQMDEGLVGAVKASQQNGVPTWYMLDGYEEVEELKTIRNNPTVEVCDYNSVIIDPTCKGDLSKASFIIHAFETSIGELTKLGIYSNLDKIDLDGNNPLSLQDSSVGELPTFKFEDNPRKKLLAYEYWGYWDVNGNDVLVPIVATWIGNTLIRLDESPYPDGCLPFELVQYLPTKGVYGESDAVLIGDNQKVIGAVTRGMVDTLARSANAQVGYRKDALDIVNKRRFEAGDDYEFNPNVHPEQAFWMHKFPEIPVSAQYLLNLHQTESESMVGNKAFSGGISGSALGATATGVRSALDATAKRDLDILNRLAKGLEGVARKMIALNAVYLNEEEVIRVTNEEFVKIDRNDLAGNFDLEIQISTAEVDNQKAEELAFMLQATGDSMPLDVRKMLLSEIADLRKMPHLAEQIRRYTPQPDPIEQERAMLELEIMKAQLALIQSQVEGNASKAMLDQAKVGTEQAKQDMTRLITDQQALDFVEQEKGVKHARALEKDKAQAEGNMRLEMLKAALNKVQGRPV